MTMYPSTSRTVSTSGTDLLFVICDLLSDREELDGCRQINAGAELVIEHFDARGTQLHFAMR